MTAGVLPQGTAGRGRRVLSGVGHFAYLLPIPVGALVMLLSLIVGASPDYVFFQFLLFAIASPLIYLLQRDDRFTTSILLASYAKNFYLSQFFTIVFLHAPDAALSHPDETLIGFILGLVAAMLGIVLARLVVAAAPKGVPVLSINITAERLRRLGYWCAIIGLPCQAIWTETLSNYTADQFGGLGGAAAGTVMFSYLAHLEVLAFCCFAAEQLIVTKGRSFISRPFLITLVAYYVLIAPLGAKAEPLIPLVAVFVVAVVFRWRFRPVPLIGGALMLVFVAEVLFPVVSMTRTRAYGEHRRVRSSSRRPSSARSPTLPSFPISKPTQRPFSSRRTQARRILATPRVSWIASRQHAQTS